MTHTNAHTAGRACLAGLDDVMFKRLPRVAADVLLIKLGLLLCDIPQSSNWLEVCAIHRVERNCDCI
jgi:hypothetical protein